MSLSDLQLVLNKPMLLGESPLWHPEQEALYWIDIAGHALHRVRPFSGEHRSWALPSEPGCIAWCLGARMLVAMRSGIVLLETETGVLTNVADAPYDPSVSRFNDGRCDAAGRLWVGSLYDPRDQPLGDLFCVERGLVRKVGNPVTVSNGVAFSPDYTRLYHADTTHHRIDIYDFDLRSGAVTNRRLFKQFSSDKTRHYGGRPDGAAVDSENAYWCAMYEGGRILRMSPQGEILREIRLPVRCPTMVAFGGPDFRTLFITSVRNKRSADELKAHPHSGYIFSLRVDVPGIAEPPYLP